jgi:hypothetical protein
MSSSSSSSGGSEVVLIVTSDFTHAGPWYRELPPQGVSLEAYMRSQDMPVLQVCVTTFVHEHSSSESLYTVFYCVFELSC